LAQKVQFRCAIIHVGCLDVSGTCSSCYAASILERNQVRLTEELVNRVWGLLLEAVVREAVVAVIFAL